jgi:hypothetical protein
MTSQLILEVQLVNLEKRVKQLEAYLATEKLSHADTEAHANAALLVANVPGVVKRPTDDEFHENAVVIGNKPDVPGQTWRTRYWLLGEARRARQHESQLLTENTDLKAQNERLKKELEAAQGATAKMYKDWVVAQVEIQDARKWCTFYQSKATRLKREAEIVHGKLTAVVNELQDLHAHIIDIDEHDCDGIPGGCPVENVLKYVEKKVPFKP